MFGLCGCGSDSEAEDDERRRMGMKRTQRQLPPQHPGPQPMMPPGMPVSGMMPPPPGMPPGMAMPPRMPVTLSEVTHQHSAVQQGMEPQEYDGVTASNVTMKTANYGGTLGQEENSSCSKPPSVDSADIIHRHPAAKYIGVAPPTPGTPLEEAQRVVVPEPAEVVASGGSHQSSEEEIKSSSSERAPTARSTAEKRKPDQTRTDTGNASRLTRDAENSCMGALFHAEENALRDGRVKSGQDIVGVRVLTTETITRRQYVYDMNVPLRMLEGGMGKPLQARGAAEQAMIQQDPLQQSAMESPYATGHFKALTSNPDPTSTPSVTDSQSGQVNIVVSCQSQGVISKSSGNLAPSEQQYLSGHGHQSPPCVEGYAPLAAVQYGPPPPQEYGPCTQRQCGPVPSAQYAPAPLTLRQNAPATTEQYGLPASGQYGPPFSEQYAPRCPVYQPRPPGMNQHHSYSTDQAQLPLPSYQEPLPYRPGRVYWMYPDNRDTQQPKESRSGLATGIYLDIGIKKPLSKAEPGKAEVENPKSISSLLSGSSSSQSSSLVAANSTSTASKSGTVPKGGSKIKSSTKAVTGTNTKTNTKSNTNAGTKTGSELGSKANSNKDKETGRKISSTARKPGKKHDSKSDSDAGTKPSSNHEGRTNSDQRGSSLCKCGHDDKKCDKACNVPSH